MYVYVYICIIYIYIDILPYLSLPIFQGQQWK